LALDALLVVLWVVILDEIIKLVSVRAVTRATVWSLVGCFILIVREYLGETATLRAAFFVPVATLETLELCLQLDGQYVDAGRSKCR
jgi:hypothetical protein